MKTDYITLYFSNEEQVAAGEFEEAFYSSLRQYSLRHLPFINDISQENIAEALQKSLQVCRLAGINSKQHFKKIYVYDADISTIHIDWRMSKRGVNLMVTQISSLNEKMARWLWELSDL
jgi:hypothetical protein